MNKCTIVDACEEVESVEDDLFHWAEGSQCIPIPVDNCRRNKEVTKVLDLGEYIMIMNFHICLFRLLCICIFWLGCFRTALLLWSLVICGSVSLDVVVLVLVVGEVKHFGSEITVRFHHHACGFGHYHHDSCKAQLLIFRHPNGKSQQWSLMQQIQW